MKKKFSVRPLEEDGEMQEDDNLIFSSLVSSLDKPKQSPIKPKNLYLPAMECEPLLNESSDPEYK